MKLTIPANRRTRHLATFLVLVLIALLGNVYLKDPTPVDSATAEAKVGRLFAEPDSAAVTAADSAAAVIPPAAATPPTERSGYLLRVGLVTLLLLAGIVFGIRWYARLTGQGTPAGGDDLTVLSRKNLGPKQSVVLMQVRGRTLLLGVTEQQITRLADLAADDTGDASPDVPAPVKRANGFAAILNGVGQKRNEHAQ